MVPTLMSILLIAAIVSSLGAPLLPSLADQLGVSLSSVQWSLTAPVLASLVAAPILGRIGDGRYRREGVIGALVVVVLGGLLTTFAGSLAMLIAGRAMQGVGLGLTPIVIATARDHLPPERSPRVIGLLSVTTATGIGGGYVISGLLATEFDVWAAFGFGAALSAVALFAAVAILPSSRGAPPVSLDLRGALVGGVGIVALVLGISQGGQWGWASAPVLGCFGLAGLFLVAWVRLQLTTATPLVELRQLRNPSVRAADVVAILVGLTMYVYVTVVAEFVQTPSSEGYGFGASALLAGLCLVPFSLASFAAGHLVAPFLVRFGVRASLIFGTLAIAAAGCLFAAFHDALWLAFATMLLVGVGYGFTYGAIPGLIARAVPPTEVGSAIGFYQVARSVGHSIGSAAVASILAVSQHHVDGAPAEGGYTFALLFGAAVCAAAALVALALSPRARLDHPEAPSQPTV
jgi:MFS family permease